jgi:hypothetical protein
MQQSAPAMQPAMQQATPYAVPSLTNFDNCGGGLGGLNAGGTLYYLKPFMPANTAYVTVTNPGTPGSSESNTSFQWHYQPAYAAWVGWNFDGGLGLRTRFFQFSSSSETDTLSNGTTPPPGTQTTINPPLANLLGLSTGGTAFGSPGSVLNSGVGTDLLKFTSSLTVSAIDLEATYLWKASNLTLLGSAGARYLQLNQSYGATLTNSGGGTGAHEYQQFNYSRNFSGVGLTAAFQGIYQIGTSNFYLFANGRASIIAGQSQENESFYLNSSYSIFGFPQSQQINPTANRSSLTTIPIVELELGAEYGVNVGRSRFFLRGAAVSQTYFDAGTATSTTGNMTLFGFQGTVGFNF